MLATEVRSSSNSPYSRPPPNLSRESYLSHRDISTPQRSSRTRDMRRLHNVVHKQYLGEHKGQQELELGDNDVIEGDGNIPRSSAFSRSS